MQRSAATAITMCIGADPTRPRSSGCARKLRDGRVHHVGAPARYMDMGERGGRESRTRPVTVEEPGLVAMPRPIAVVGGSVLTEILTAGLGQAATLRSPVPWRATVGPAHSSSR